MSLLTRCHHSIKIATRIAVTKPPTRSFCAPKPTSTANTEKRNLNAPIRFVGSPAAMLAAKESRSGTVNIDDVPDCQVYIVCGSLAIFLFYFCILREENDVDLKLTTSLYDNVPGLEATQLVINYKYNIENNKDNTEIVNRMKELGMNPEDIK